MLAKKHIFFNEIYTSIFEKRNFPSPNEWSIFQLLDAIRLNNKGALNSYKTAVKTILTKNSNKF